MTLGEKLSAIQQEFKAKKSRFNQFGKYNFRSAEDILEGLKPFNKKYGVYFVVSEDIHTDLIDNPTPIVVSTATIYDTQSDATIKATAVVGVDLAQKGMQIPQAFGSASSYGKKYALGNLLLIDDTADADATNNHGKTSAPTSAPATAKKDDSFQQSIDYLKATPDANKGSVLNMILEKYGSKFSPKQVEALKKFV